MSNKKSEQLGMNPGTASHRLVKDILFNLICETGKNRCYQCGKEMSRDTFSIEHKKPWLDSKTPSELYFDLDNISFSHLKCNRAASRGAKRLTQEEARERRLERFKRYRRENYTPERRRSQYERTGK